jgi:hypothetical protein
MLSHGGMCFVWYQYDLQYTDQWNQWYGSPSHGYAAWAIADDCMSSSIQSVTTVVKMSMVLSWTGTGKVLHDSRSTPTNIRCSLTVRPLQYLGRLSVLLTISTVLLILQQQPSTYTNMIYLQYVAISNGCNVEMMLSLDSVSTHLAHMYVTNITSMRVELLCWNHELYLWGVNTVYGSRCPSTASASSSSSSSVIVLVARV